MKILHHCFLILLFVSSSTNASNFSCPAEIRVNRNSVVQIDANAVALKRLSPQFFGFNLELLEFQDSLWDKKNGRVETEAISLLRRFPGAIYRYPGGTISNHFNWQLAIGPLNSRLPQKTVDYQNAKVIEFGPIEFLNFVHQVDGTPWYVLNLQGAYEATDTPVNLAESAARLVEHLKKPDNKGLPKVYRWELGNELDRGRYRWAPDKYTAIAAEVAKGVSNAGSDAGFVVMGQDWEHTGARPLVGSFNAHTAKSLTATSNEYSFHLYYDGPPWGPPLPRVIRQLCKNIGDTQTPKRTSKIWVTEFGRTPNGIPTDSFWKNNWPQTSGLSAAISAADLMISLAPIKDLEGAFSHSLHATSGPWPIFHKRNDGVIYPSAVYWSLVILRETMLEDVLTSKITTSTESGNSAGYDTSSIVMASPNRQKFAVWTAQRGNSAAQASIAIPQLAGMKVLVKTRILASNDINDNNYSVQYKIFPKRSEFVVSIDSTGTFTYPIAANSITSLSLDIIQKTPLDK